MPTGIYKRTEEHRRKLGIAHKGKTTSSVFKKGSIPCCNIALGLLKDDINIFLSAIDYLKQYDQS